MKHTTQITPLLLALAVSYSAQAEISSPHSIGLTISGGGIDYKGKDTDGVGVAQSYLYYNYQFSPHYYLEVGVTNSEDFDDWECDSTGESSWDCRSDHNNSFALDADNYSQDGLIIAAKTDLALSKRNSLYAKVGAEFYQYDLSLAQNKFADESGVGLFVEAGWEYRWDNSIGINAGVWHHDLGDLESTSINLGLSYAF
jgi:opacity protein-like surface antigen